MTTNHNQAQQGKTIFGISLVFFSQGLYWFGVSSPGGLFAFRPLNMSDAFSRAEIVFGILLAAYGMLLWRSASRKFARGDFVIVSSCVAVLLLGVSKLSEWIYFLDKHAGFSMNALGVIIMQIAIPVCIFILGAWWADSAFMHDRFERYMRPSRFVK
jgi:hypothetical protein